jgi:hypothetical protein
VASVISVLSSSIFGEKLGRDPRQAIVSDELAEAIVVTAADDRDDARARHIGKRSAWRPSRRLPPVTRQGNRM